MVDGGCHVGHPPTPTQRIFTMNKDQVKGRIEQATGKAKEVAGSVLGNDKLQVDGLADQAEGKAQSVFGDTKENAKDAAKKIIDSI
jgi:uncharacterized protein YjbJ (UPF0337 family)